MGLASHSQFLPTCHFPCFLYLSLTFFTMLFCHLSMCPPIHLKKYSIHGRNMMKTTPTIIEIKTALTINNIGYMIFSLPLIVKVYHTLTNLSIVTFRPQRSKLATKGRHRRGELLCLAVLSPHSLEKY